MADSNNDAPETLSAAEEKFRTFLATQNYPKSFVGTSDGARAMFGCKSGVGTGIKSFC
jgi:hypothetical protein